MQTTVPYGWLKPVLSGGLDRISYARPGKLFTANHSLIVREVGQLTAASFDELLAAVVAILRG